MSEGERVRFLTVRRKGRRVNIERRYGTVINVFESSIRIKCKERIYVRPLEQVASTGVRK